MGASLLITFRETFEASLVISVILAYLHRTNNMDKDRIVWSGVAAGIFLSMVFAFGLNQWMDQLDEEAHEIVETVIMLVAAGLILWTVAWMTKAGKSMRGHIEAKIQTHLSSAAMTGLFSLALLTVLREGAETVIFLTAAWSGIQSMGQSSGAVLGIVLAIIVGFALFQGMMKWFSIKWFFRLTSIFLFLFALHLAWEALEELIVG
jgi:high-affinity iron transporter